MSFTPFSESLPTTQPVNNQPIGGFTPYNANMLTPQQPSQPGVLPKPQMPILTNEQGGFGTALKDIVVGAGKDLVGGAIDVASGLQGIGQRALATLQNGGNQFPKGSDRQTQYESTLKNVQVNTGLKSLDESTPEGTQINEQLKAKSRGEQVGKVLSTATQIVAPFSGGNAEKLIAKGKSAYEGYQVSREAKLAEKTTTKAFESITPKTTELTPTEYENLLGKQKITPKTTTSPAQYVLSDAEKQTATKYKDLLQSSDPVKNSMDVINKIAKTDKEVGVFLRQNNGTFNNGELKNYILDKLQGVSDVTISESRLSKLKQTIVDNFTKSLPKNDMENLWKSRKAFDQKIESAFNGSPTLQNTIKREFRNAIQDYIAERTPEGVYKQSMKDMRELFNLQDTIATKASKEKALNKIQLWLKNNPTKAKIIGWTTGVLGAEQIYQHLK